MSIDEYLQIERERGNILTGGGYVQVFACSSIPPRLILIFNRPQSEQEPTSSEQLALDSEQDGTAFAEEQSEAKRLKDENWARYTDDNPKGAGNTMNRG